VKKGITLIALIITIVIMLILAGLVLNMTLEGGIFAQTEMAVELTRISQLQEEISKWKQEEKIKGKVSSDTRTVEEKIIDEMDKLIEEKLLTETEKQQILNAGKTGTEGYKIEKNIGGNKREIDFNIDELTGGGKGNVEPEMPQVPKDETIPTITINPTSAAVCKSTNITITVADVGSGLSSDNSYQWQLGTSNTTAPIGDWTTYTSGTGFTAGTALTGTYYLWVKQISDNAGNKSIATIGSYTVAGTYVFDNTPPTVNAIVDPSGWANEKAITINATDVGSAGLHSTAYSFDNGETWQSGNTKTVNANGTSQIKVKDALENVASVTVEITQIDKTAPTVTVSPTSQNTISTSVTVSITATDMQSGVSAVKAYWSTNSTALDANSSTWDSATTVSLSGSIGTTQRTGSTSFSLTTTPLYLQLHIIDVAGNVVVEVYGHYKKLSLTPAVRAYVTNTPNPDANGMSYERGWVECYAGFTLSNGSTSQMMYQYMCLAGVRALLQSGQLGPWSITLAGEKATYTSNGTPSKVLDIGGILYFGE
jgi:hypothetical protein